MTKKIASTPHEIVASLKEKGETFDQFTVVKRNGTMVPFRRERILRAIDLAFHDTKEIDFEQPLPTELREEVEKVTDQVIAQLFTLATKGTSLTVEGIQDLVEVTLMKLGHHDVARDYIIYRDHHKQHRDDSPHHLRVVRSDGSLVRFNPMKIATSIEEAFRRARKIEGQTPAEIIKAVNILTEQVVARATEHHKNGEQLHVSTIQDEIEHLLMKEKFYQVAKFYILHRAAIEEQSLPAHDEKAEGKREFTITTADGKTRKIKESHIKARLQLACRDIPEASVDELLETIILHFYEGIKEHEVDQAALMAARTKIEFEPAYSKVAARLLTDLVYREAMDVSAGESSLVSNHLSYFKKYIKFGISVQRLSPDLLEFDLDKLGKAIDLKRDDLFSYLGLQTLYDRYFIHHQERRIETPQIFWMRVAMGLALQEGDQKNERAIEFYNLLSQFHFTSATPTLFNSGTTHSQLSSCYLSTVMDDLGHIFKVISDDAQLSKWAGGIGNDWTNVRATGSLIKGTNGKSQGIIPFLKVANDTAVAVNQCFAPQTLIYTADGVRPICEIEVGDLVLGVSGTYRAVTETFAYNQTDPMVALTLENSLEPIVVTAGHPFYAIRGIPNDASPFEWVEAGELSAGDFVAQVVPKEVVPVDNFTTDDARFYGLMLKNGRIDGATWSVTATDRTFISTYLHDHQIGFTEDRESGTVSWTMEQSVVRDGTAGYALTSSPLPITAHDCQNAAGQFYIAPRLSHLPQPHTVALLEALLGAQPQPSLTFTHTSSALVETVRYQLLRQAIPTSGDQNRLDTKEGVVIHNYLWSRVEKRESVATQPFVFDLEVEGDESYMTTAALAHNGGKRKGAMCAYLETWHLDIEDFLELRKNTGDDRRRTHDMNTANWIPDLFMKRVMEKGRWTLFSPSDTPDLHHLYGQAFEKRYVEYEKMADSGKLKLHKKIEAQDLWRKMLSMLFETGHPWITFKDPSNVRSPQDHVGVVHCSNLCTEILLNNSVDETAVCNLGSINLGEHCTPHGIDEKKLAATIRTAVRMLDNVIDINFYPTAEAKNANLRHRPIGLGLMGFQDALYIQNISYASHEAVAFADRSMEMISYYAILASTELAQERGAYSTYQGSKWERGLLPIDTIELLAQERQGHLEVDRSTRMNWDVVRAAIKKYGMRNCNTMAIAPTATISNIIGTTQSIEPMYKHLFVKSNLSGEFTIPNTFLVDKLKSLGLWDKEMLDDLKYFDGSITEIERVPDDVKRLFLTSFEIDPEWIIECASRRQKWIDMGQSLNLYISEPSGKKLDQMYMFAWIRGLKTTYYLRSVAATQIEKSTTDINKRGLQPRWMKSQSASSNIRVERDEPPAPKACRLGDESCESCQ